MTAEALANRRLHARSVYVAVGSKVIARRLLRAVACSRRRRAPSSRERSTVATYTARRACGGHGDRALAGAAYAAWTCMRAPYTLDRDDVPHAAVASLLYCRSEAAAKTRRALPRLPASCCTAATAALGRGRRPVSTAARLTGASWAMRTASRCSTFGTISSTCPAGADGQWLLMSDRRCGGRGRRCRQEAEPATTRLAGQLGQTHITRCARCMPRGAVDAYRRVRHPPRLRRRLARCSSCAAVSAQLRGRTLCGCATASSQSIDAQLATERRSMHAASSTVVSCASPIALAAEIGDRRSANFGRT